MIAFLEKINLIGNFMMQYKKLLMFLWVVAFNLTLYPLAMGSAYAWIADNLGALMCIFNIPNAYFGMKLIEKKNNFLFFKWPEKESLIRSIIITVVFSLATLLLKVVCFPLMVLINTGAIDYSILAIYCLISVPIQEMCVRGVLQSVWYDFMDSCWGCYTWIQNICSNKTVFDLSKVMTNACFFMFHLHKGLAFSLASFVLGLYWSEMSLFNSSTGMPDPTAVNLVYPTLSHMVVGGFAFLLSFEVWSTQLLAAGSLPAGLFVLGIAGWLMFGDRSQRLGGALTTMYHHGLNAMKNPSLVLSSLMKVFNYVSDVVKDPKKEWNSLINPVGNRGDKVDTTKLYPVDAVVMTVSDKNVKRVNPQPGGQYYGK